VSEYRALRASVAKLWGARALEPTRQSAAELDRFNEAIDQATTESISCYSKKVDQSVIFFWASWAMTFAIPSDVGRIDRKTRGAD
jgi:hypothetical protein